jgi:hypothetical protein
MTLLTEVFHSVASIKMENWECYIDELVDEMLIYVDTAKCSVACPKEVVASQISR